MNTITLNQLIKRLYIYRAEHVDSGRKPIYLKDGVPMQGEIAESNDDLTLL